jgi:hypothetical protein
MVVGICTIVGMINAYDNLYVQVYMREANPAYYALDFLKQAVK